MALKASRLLASFKASVVIPNKLVLRYFSSSQQSLPGPKSLSAIPFQVTRATAQQAFEQHYQGHFFAAKPSSGLQKQKESFLPFWVISADAAVTLKGAQLGFDRWVTRYNTALKRPTTQLETDWRWVSFERANWEQRYSTHEPGMQIYASYKYPRSEIHALRPGAAIQIAREFKGSMAVSEYDGSTRRIGPYQMKPATALRFASEWIRKEEESRARSFLRSTYRCDRIGIMELDVRLSDQKASAVLLPAFVFRSSHFGFKVRTFVSGVQASLVSGTRPLDETKVGFVGGLATFLTLLGTANITTLSFQLLVWGFAAPGLVIGFAARYYTYAWRQWNAYRQQSEREKQQDENERGSWDPEWVRAYARMEEEYRRRDESENTRGFGSSFTGRAGDSRGYYAALGIQNNASKQEVQAAFRGLAMQHHPDRVPDSQKQAASKKFQQVQEAYSVLRDDKKRKDYDSGY